jgi:hypothetical protein
MLLSKTQYSEKIEGYVVTDCAVRESRAFHFMTRDVKDKKEAGVLSEGNVKKRMVVVVVDPNGAVKIGTRTFEGYGRIHMGASRNGEIKGVTVTVDGEVAATGEGKTEEENPIPFHKFGPRRGAIQRVRMIQQMLYAVGSGHTVCRRRGRNDWESLCYNLSIETRSDHDDDERSANMAFEDIDGFSAEDLYAIAGKGRLWHFDGKGWNPIDLPTGMFVNSICCGGDGNVYIGAPSGDIYKGRNSEWRLIAKWDLPLPFQDIVWHSEKIWCTNDYGLWTLDGDNLREATLPSSIKVCVGNLSAGYGVMLMAGAHGAAYHDGANWHVIFNAIEPK